MRAITFVIVLSVLVPHVVSGIKTGQPVSFSGDELTLILGVLGIKTVQRGLEGKAETKKEETP